MIYANLLIGAGYLLLAILPCWDIRSEVTYLLRATFIFCGLGHLVHIFPWPLTQLYIDLVTGMIAVTTVCYLVFQKRKITTLKND